MIEIDARHRRAAAVVVAGAFLLASVVLLANRAHGPGILTALVSVGAFGLLDGTGDE
ncbi:hypothetical protein [Halomicrobium urmianum]|uniref:hypothetical protein n=1 Tax=Halomicrobium urmianum TaxID=1586233 RepID=UPI001CD9303A|nr:hypothetical protein [Halomicrobium urmianum]